MHAVHVSAFCRQVVTSCVRAQSVRAIEVLSGGSLLQSVELVLIA
jgi:hypothetical protein